MTRYVSHSRAIARWSWSVLDAAGAVLVAGVATKAEAVAYLESWGGASIVRVPER